MRSTRFGCYFDGIWFENIFDADIDNQRAKGHHLSIYQIIVWSLQIDWLILNTEFDLILYKYYDKDVQYFESIDL